MKTYHRYSRTNIYFVHHNFVESENLSTTGKLLKATILGYYALAVAKSAAERGNSNISQTANSSTPLNRAFFVRSLRTPKENALSVLLSMVGRNGQRLIVGCIPFEAVFHPVMLYRQAWKLAVVPQQFQTELSSMIYKFLLLGSQRLKITVHANNKAEALSRVQFASTPLLVARLRNPLVNNSQNLTACDTEQNHSLLSVGGCGYDNCTTKTVTGNRTRKTCDFFVSQIQQNHGITTPEIYSEFAIRLISRNKADFIRTNKASRVTAVVETVSHLSAIYPFNNLLKTVTAMKKPTQTLTGTTATSTPIVRSPRFEGVQYV
ncbi:ash family protein [Mannheimia indoligenes]|uniref:ash family protein n=1 Tax=Mannheimia indoligenes TaxID=3103145 RepID=UPI002FE5E518